MEKNLTNNNERTSTLERVFEKTKLNDIDKVLLEHKDSMISPSDEFYNFIRNIFDEKKLKIKEVIFNADIDMKYGYKLLNKEKITPQRDLILRICYSAKLNLEETQKALRLYGMNELYPKVKRDAIMMVLFNDRPGDIYDFNEFLIKKGEKPLKTSGNEQ